MLYSHTHTRKQRHTHTHTRLSHSFSRQKCHTHGTEWVQWIHAAGRICTHREQNEEYNLERRGRGGGCAAPCSMEVWPTTSTPLHHHTKAKETFGKRQFETAIRNHILISGCHAIWIRMTDLFSQMEEKNTFLLRNLMERSKVRAEGVSYLKETWMDVLNRPFCVFYLNSYCSAQPVNVGNNSLLSCREAATPTFPNV